MPEIVFLNHSSLLVTSPQTAILCDPWYTGTAFNNGWRLLAEDSHDPNSIPATHIWLSHEHPDHFSPLTLAKLTSPRRFLYQRAPDGKVRNYLTSRGHTVQEIDDATPTRVNDLDMTIFVSDGYDSAALFEFAGGTSFLNINDARVELGDTLTRIQARLKSPPKAIAIQFSYANWAGNPGDPDIPLHQQNLVIERILHIARALRPGAVMLFASFVYCSHEENFYWNHAGESPTGKSWLPYVVETLERHGLRVIVPQPDQRFDLATIDTADHRPANSAAIAFWEALAAAKTPVDRTDRSVTLEALRSAYSDFIARLWNENAVDAARTPRNVHFQLRVHLSDFEQTIALNLFEDRFALTSDPADCTVSAETLLFLFKNKFGRGTVTVNGRIQFNYPTAHRFFLFFFIPYGNNIGRYYRDRPLTRDLLASIRQTSVMLSILQFHPEAARRFEEDLALFAAPLAGPLKECGRPADSQNSMPARSVLRAHL